MAPHSGFSWAEEFERRFVRPNAGRTLVVGSFVTAGKEDRRARYANALGVDQRHGPGVDMVLDLEQDLPRTLGTFAHVECLSVLEHARRPWLLAANIERLMEPGATLHVQVPFVWRFHDYPGDYWRFTHEGVREMFPGIRWEKLMYAGDRLREDTFLKAREFDGLAHLPRTEVCGWGIRE